MLTLTYAVIGYYFFGQVTTFSGFGGITGIRPAGVLRRTPGALLLPVRRAVGGRVRGVPQHSPRTPFGLALQGVRDDPVRMASLGFNVALQRTIAFTIAGFVAGVAGVLNIWWNGQIDPTSISIGPTMDLLIVAVIGGIAYLEGAWLGAFVFVIANNYMRDLPLASSIGLDRSAVHDRGRRARAADHGRVAGRARRRDPAGSRGTVAVARQSGRHGRRRRSSEAATDARN